MPLCNQTVIISTDTQTDTDQLHIRPHQAFTIVNANDHVLELGNGKYIR